MVGKQNRKLMPIQRMEFLGVRQSATEYQEAIKCDTQCH